MNKPKYYLLVSFLCLFPFFLFACSGVKDTVPPDSTPPKSNQPITTQVTQATQVDEEAILKETQAFIAQFSKDLSGGKAEAVLKQIDSSTCQQIGDTLDLSSPGAKKLAEAISKAKSTQVNQTIVFYESTIDSETMSFYIIKEAGQWKFGGL